VEGVLLVGLQSSISNSLEQRTAILVAAKAATLVKEVAQLYQLAIGGSAIGSRRELAPAEGQKENAAPPPNKLDEQWVRTPPKGSGTGLVNEEELRTDILKYLDAGVNSNCDVGMRESSTRVEVQ
jgi:hypothetical protein